MIDIPGYTIEEELGRGGMATVYRALQLSVERRVALKVMSPMLLVDSQFSERFLREAKIAAHLYHPHVVAVHDVGVHEGQPYIAMEYLQNGDLASRIKDGKLDLPNMLRIAREIAAALNYAHQKGFVHRDVKPENILFREDESAVLTDFGIARALNSATQMTRTGAVIGTPQYMSPEQARGRDLDGRSDLYGLGIVLYEMLEGKAPFEGTDSISVGIKHVTEPVPKVRRHGRVQPLLDRFLAKAPDERFQSGAEAAAQIKILETQIVTGQMPAISDDDVARAREEAKSSSLGETAVAPSPIPRPRKAPVSATPRPDGSLRHEPTLGSLEDFSSFERTVAQPSLSELQKSASEPTSKKGGLLVLVLTLALAAGAAWWQRDRLATLFSDQDIEQLLSAASAAENADRWFGDDDTAASLYGDILADNPDNAAAREGLRRVADEMIRRARQARTTGDTDRATNLARQALTLVPEHAGAAEFFDQVEQATPANSVSVLLDEADDLAQSGRLSLPDDPNAADVYRQALALDPGNARAASGLASITEQLAEDFTAAMDAGDLAAARQSLEGLKPLDPPGGIALYVDRLDQALELQREAQAEADRAAAAARARQEQIESHLAQGRSYLQNGQLEQAEQAFESARTLAPGSSAATEGITEVAAALLARAEADLEADRLDAAEDLIARAANLAPQMQGLNQARSRLRLYRTQSERRLSASEQARLDDLVNQAATALRSGNLMRPPGSSAFDLFKAALRIDPGSDAVARGLRELAGTLINQASQAIGAGDSAGAYRAILDAQQADPRHPELESVRLRTASKLRESARVAIEDGRLDEAETSIGQAAELEPGNEQLLDLQRQLSIASEQG